MESVYRSIFSAILIAGVLMTTAMAGPTRKWTDTTGKFSVDAEFVELKNGEVHLRKPDGSVITVPAKQLSDADRVYLSNRVTSKPAPVATATSPEEKRANAEAASLTKLADDEGNITRDAWSKFIQAFRDFDADSDDALNLEELKVAGREELLMKLADTNTDGKIVRGEWAPLSKSFARLDKNKNAILEVVEMQAAAEVTLAKSSGTASLAATNDPAKPAASTGPTLWRGRIEGRGRIELVIAGTQIVGREIDGSGQGINGLGTGNYSMTGDGKLGNLDAVYLDGPQRGQVCYGIYQLNGDTLTWCCNNRGQRPTRIQRRQRQLADDAHPRPAAVERLVGTFRASPGLDGRSRGRLRTDPANDASMRLRAFEERLGRDGEELGHVRGAVASRAPTRDRAA